MLSKLDRLRAKVTGGESEGSLSQAFYALAKELGCVGDLVGRDYELVYDGDRITGFRQLPMKVPTFIVFLKELEKDFKQQEKSARRMKSKGRRR